MKKTPITQAGKGSGMTNARQEFLEKDGAGLIQELQRQIDELKKRWPAHSTPVSMLQRLDELEDELAEAVRRSEG